MGTTETGRRRNSPAGGECPTHPERVLESLLPGDLDCDCDVDIVDIMMVCVVWNTYQGDADFKPAYDFDGDGRISIADIMYVAAKWRTQCR